jgi:hypothetical protein
LIVAHEVGGTHEADLVQAADRLSFLETNIDLFLGFVQSGRFSIDDVRTKFEHSYHRIGVPDAKALALPLYEKADARLGQLAASNGNGDGKVPTDSKESRPRFSTGG